MINIFKKKKRENVEEKIQETNIKPEASEKHGEEIIRISVEIDKLKAEVESLKEIRKSFSERFSRVSEQIGELRALIVDRDRTLQTIELKAIKAADLVKAVQPEKLMIEVQREDAKIEGLKATLEANQAIMSKIMQELRNVRNRLAFFRGLQEIERLAEEVKKELIEIKKLEASISIKADKVETIFGEMKKRIREVEEFKDKLHEIAFNVEQHTKDIETLKIKIAEVPKKEEIDKLFTKIQRYTNALKELEKKSSLSKDCLLYTSPSPRD